MINYSSLYKSLQAIPSLASWGRGLEAIVRRKIYASHDGNLPRWLKALESLPDLRATEISLDTDVITLTHRLSCIQQQTLLSLEKALRQLHPWRKGPFDLFGIFIDSEWRCDMKWNRLKAHLAPLDDRVILDVGANNGYYGWRMIGQGARLVVGIDPTLLYVCQYHAIARFMGWSNMAVLPLGIDDMPEDLSAFDTVFSMGLLYHRRSPFDHLLRLQSLMREGGELVLETLVVDGKAGEVLSPCGRYARMPNVWFIPSVLTLEAWLKRCQFKDIRCVDVCQTTTDEQRVTGWMGFHSLANFLHPEDNNQTIEGYPAPKRAILIATK